MENNLNKVPFADFTNYEPPVEESVDHRETSPTELLDSSGHQLEVPTFYLKNNENILTIQRIQDEIIQSWHQNQKLCEIFKVKRTAFIFYIDLLIQRLKKPHIFSKQKLRLNNETYKSSKRVINKIIQLVLKFKLLPSYLIKRKQVVAEIRTTTNQPKLTFSIDN